MRSVSPLDKEYLYDYTPSPRSATTRSSSPSPFHFLYPVMPSPSSTPSSSSSIPPHTPHHHSLSSSHHTPGGKGKRHTRKKEREAQEIARLLDPSYQGASLQSAKKDGHRRSLEAYIDTDGDLHDPDFRYFPAAETFVSQTRRDAMDRGRRSSGGAASPIKRRPYWELDNEHAFLSDEEEEEEILARELGSTDFLTQAGHGNGTSASESSAMRSRRNNRRDGSFSSYGFGYSGYSSSSAHPHSCSYYSPTMTNTTLPTSYDSENTLLTNADTDGEKDKGLLKRRRRGAEKEKEHTATVMLLEATREEEKEDHHGQRAVEDEDENAPIEQPDYVPTCTEALKRHWLSFSLKFRFGVYRSQRRFMRRVNSLF